MKLSVPPRLGVLLSALVFLSATSSALGQIPSPDSVLGFHVGEDRKLADWGQVLDYFQRIAAAAPERVKFKVIGKSTLGKPFVYLTITSPDNISHLDHYLEIQERLADPRGVSNAEAERFLTEGRAVVLITCTVHSTEVASTQTAMEYVYKLLTEDTPSHRAILNNVIFLLIPSLNPDGQDLVVKWYRKYVGTPYEGAEPVDLYHPYTGHDNNRDWYMFTQVETRLAIGKVNNIWHPQVVYDVHQMDATEARLFVPPFLDPTDPNIDSLLVEETNWLGSSIAADLATAGKKGIAVNAVYDQWSAARHYQLYHAGLRILTESASARLASPITVPFASLETQGLGYNAQQRSWNFPDPWPGGEWHLRDIVDYQLIAFEACLYRVAQNREIFLRNFYQVGKNAVEWKDRPYGYVLPAKQKDIPATIKLLNTLQFGLVEVYRAKDKFTADGIEYTAGSYVIPLAQPYGHFAKTLLERQRYPDLREYPGGPPKRPYDATAQTLPLLMGVDHAEVAEAFKADLEKMDQIALPRGKVEPPGKQYLLRPDSSSAYRAVNHLLKTKAQIARARSAFRDSAGRDFPPGTFVIRSANVRELEDFGVDFFASDLPVPDAVALHQPRLGVYKTYEPSVDEGWTRWLLEQYEFPYTSLYDGDMRAADLRSRFDVIVIPDQKAKAIVDGHPRRPVDAAGAGQPPAVTAGTTRPGLAPYFVPDEFTGGIGAPGVANLRDFVVRGGTLVTLNRASDFATEKLGVGARNILRNIPAQNFYGPGSILRIDVNGSHPLGYGTDKESIAWFDHGPAFAPSFLDPGVPAATPVASYPNGNPLMSGWLLGDSLIHNQGALMDAPLGRGHVVLFGFRPQYRGQSYATFKMFFNALYYFER